jgi:hypothetical protein
MVELAAVMPIVFTEMLKLLICSVLEEGPMGL